VTGWLYRVGTWTATHRRRVLLVWVLAAALLIGRHDEPPATGPDAGRDRPTLGTDHGHDDAPTASSPVGPWRSHL
jgi:hypothetical protein